MMPPDLNPPTNEKGYITGSDKTPHIAATAARVFGLAPRQPTAHPINTRGAVRKAG